MTADENGFPCPVVDAEKCIACGLCEKICPIISKPKMPECAPQAYAAYSRDTSIRLGSSSGGIFTELAKAVLEHRGAVFGAAYNEQFEVVHICAESEADLAKLRGAKYAQSDLRGIFTEVKDRLDQGQKVLFSGTPCQVGGLKAFLRKDYANLTTVDFVCHSVPSPMAWRKYMKYRAERDNNGKMPATINLRAKQTGWTNYQYSNLFTYADGHTHTARSGESLYIKLFVGGYINRESCANCQFKGYTRVSDLTIGDFWGIWDIAPEMDDNKGTSVVLVQSQRGRKLLERISDQLVLKPVTLEEASRQNQAMLNPSQPNARRAEALAKIRNGEIGDCEGWFVPAKPSVLQQVRRTAGRILRRLRKK
jgi:coenzyme F420-reducing hydrogenase beta subunit